eukprot:TRINITY_DN9212_c0_g1_i1.p1 TRINITY_DN9212_c0_g1~~TRINITY_DN9212_c0_g1_i1.p1  ORF type:complete len:206 (+),score=55.58 TRINITY_DN9212_c0_g1_i1:136-753(+)
MSGGLVRFRVTGITSDVTHEELLEALNEQLTLDDVVLREEDIQPDPTGGQVAEFTLPREEAKLLKSVYSEAKVFVRETMVLTFQEIRPGGRGSSGAGGTRATSIADVGDGRQASGSAKQKAPTSAPPAESGGGFGSFFSSFVGFSSTGDAATGHDDGNGAASLPVRSGGSAGHDDGNGAASLPVRSGGSAGNMAPRAKQKVTRPR